MIVEGWASCGQRIDGQGLKIWWGECTMCTVQSMKAMSLAKFGSVNFVAFFSLSLPVRSETHPCLFSPSFENISISVFLHFQKQKLKRHWKNWKKIAAKSCYHSSLFAKVACPYLFQGSEKDSEQMITPSHSYSRSTDTSVKLWAESYTPTPHLTS